MRLAKEMVVNLTVNEHIRNRVSKTRRGFMGLFRKKNEIYRIFKTKQLFF